MKLTVDIGNTLTKTGIFEGKELVKNFSTELASLLPELEKIFEENTDKGKNISCSIISAVRDYDSSIKSFLIQKTGFKELSVDMPLPVKIDYETPQTLGKDRLAAACGAVALFPGSNILVIDAGTCITYDFVCSEGIYHGGAISPGIDMRFKALNTFTGNLPLVNRKGISNLTGKSTIESIKSGVLNGIVAEVEGVISEYGKKYKDLKIIFTGGDTIFFDKRLKSNIFAVPNLVLIGLNAVLDYNEKEFFER